MAVGVRERLRRVPLALKVVGAGLPLVVVVLGLAIWSFNHVTPSYVLVALSLAVAATVGLCATLVFVALQPLAELKATVERFAAGDTSVRVAEGAWADDEVRQFGNTLNRLLDALQRDRQRASELAENVLLETDEERIRIADELYDSTAQSLTALLFELQAVTSTATDEVTRSRLENMRRIGAAVLSEIRELSHSAHPKVLKSRGLHASLEQLVESSSRGDVLRTTYTGTAAVDALSPGAAALVYRVVQAALRHAGIGRAPRTVQVDAEASQMLHLVVVDDGPPYHENQERNVSYAALRRRAELSGGSLVRSVQGHRRTLRLDLPLRRTPSGDSTSSLESPS